MNNNNSVSVVDEVLKIFNNNWNRQVILYGPPGTSKTYSAVEIAAKLLAGKYGENSKDGKAPAEWDHDDCKGYLSGKSDRYKVVQFHPSYSYEDFVRGIKVEVKQGEQLPTYSVERKILEEFCKGMEKDENEYRVLVIDEINRAPLASVLGELIYGLEYRGEAIYTPYTLTDKNDQSTDKQGEPIPLVVPKNLYIIGTMNTADRSIGSMDYAVRRRFAFVEVPSCKDAIAGSWGKVKGFGERVEEFYTKLMEEAFATDLMTDGDEEVANDIKIGHTYFLGNDQIKDENDAKEYFTYRVKYQILPIYKEYVKDGLIKESGLEAFKKVLNSFEGLIDIQKILPDR